MHHGDRQLWGRKRQQWLEKYSQARLCTRLACHRTHGLRHARKRQGGGSRQPQTSYTWPSLEHEPLEKPKGKQGKQPTQVSHQFWVLYLGQGKQRKLGMSLSLFKRWAVEEPEGKPFPRLHRRALSRQERRNNAEVNSPPGKTEVLLGYNSEKGEPERAPH